MFAAILDAPDAVRAASVVQKFSAHGLPMVLTGGLAIEARLRAHGGAVVRRSLKDLDLLVDDFDRIPPSVVNDFLVHHVHPFAPEGKLLLQLIDAEQSVRIDVFRSFGQTLSRATGLGENTGPLEIVAVEDLVARTTSHVCSDLVRGRLLCTKFVSAFRRLSGLGERALLEDAWEDHREGLQMTFDAATHQASRLIECRPELLIDEEFSTVVNQCDRCEDYGPFHRSTPESIVRILGYW